MNLDEIRKECEMYQAELETLLPDDANAVEERGKTLGAYLARIGYLLAEAKLLARKKKSSEISETIIKIAKQNYLSAKAQNALVDSIAEEELFIVDWLDRLNSTCVHDLDFIRTVLSKAKAEMQYLNFNS